MTDVLQPEKKGYLGQVFIRLRAQNIIFDANVGGVMQ